MRNKLTKPVLASRLAEALGLPYEGGEVLVYGVTPLSTVEPKTLTFARAASDASFPEGVCVLTAEKPKAAGWIRSESPRFDFVRALLILEKLGTFEVATNEPEIHPTATIAKTASLGKDVKIGARTRVEASVKIGDNVIIGEDCWIKAGCVIGEDGFGFERDKDGTPIRMLHFGGVRIGNRVEVGSVTTVCQGTLGPTVIEDDAKVDDHVHVAHNCHIKKMAFVIACAELSGGVVVGERAWIGPNASVLEKVTIGDDALVGLGAVVLRHVANGVTVVGNPAKVLERKPKP